jgi:thioredoxin 1
MDVNYMTTEAKNDLNAIREQKAKELLQRNINVHPTIPKHVVELHSVKDFENLVTEFKDNLIIIDFWAVWCGPCQAFAPTFKELQHKYGEKGIIFAKLNVDEVPQIPGQFGIDGIPTSLFIRNKKIIHEQVGALPLPAFAQVIQHYLK